ncbi:MAG: MFS transporter [Gammaproteobacteria bacterium]|nr:MFS transporter [Gammaproteobacteria bacterium]
MKSKLATGSVFLLIVAFLLNTAFLRSVLIDGYQVDEIKRFLIQMESASKTIENLLINSEKRLSVADMREVLNSQRQDISAQWESLRSPNSVGDYFRVNRLVDLTIVLTSGSKLVTTLNESSESDTLPELVEQILEIANDRHPSGLDFVEDNDSYYIPYPLFDSQGRWIVNLIYQFHKKVLRHAVSPRFGVHIAPTLLVGLFSAFGILFFYFRLAFKHGVTRQKTFIVDFTLIMLASLLCSLLVNAVIFKRQILEATIDNARQTITEISARLNDRQKSKISGLTSGNEMFGFSKTFFRFDNFESIILTNSHGQQIYSHRDGGIRNSGIKSAVQTVVLGRSQEKQFRVVEKLTLPSLAKLPAGNAVIHISKEDIFRNWVSMLIKGVTILFITVLVMVECLLLYLHLLAKRNATTSYKSRYELGFVRPAMFLFLFAIDLSMSIIPLHMQSFDAELFGLSRDIVLGLPISSEFLFVGIFILIAGVWMDRRGWHEPFFIGLLVVGIGSLCSWIAEDALLFILSRALVGIGYGLSLMSAQGLIVTFGGVAGRARGFAKLFAGLYSGSICGAASGAFLAERFGYEKVFLIGAVVVLVLIIFSWKFMHSLVEPVEYNPELEKTCEKSIKLKKLFKFIGNPVFIALSILSSLPASIAVAGFLHFFTPVYLDQVGVRESTIGQVLILYGICLIYFGPLIGRFIDRSQNKKYYMLTGGVLGGLAFATFNTDFGIASMIVSIFLLGLSNSFVLSSQSTMVLELSESRELGEGTALGIFRSISRIGQVVGPIIFSWVLLSGDLTQVINYLGYSYIGAMLILLFFVMNHPGGMKNQKLAPSK